MSNIETAEQYAARLCCHIVDTLTRRMRPVDAKASTLALITARDAAVAREAKRVALFKAKEILLTCGSDRLANWIDLQLEAPKEPDGEA